MDDVKSVTATFTLKTHDLTVNTAGNGSGEVTSSPAGIDCTRTAGVKSGDCSATYDHGTSVVLTAAEDAASSTFGGWDGDCNSTTATTCTVNMDDVKSVTATFDLDVIELAIRQTLAGLSSWFDL
jgi:hypothetical protein